jgi:hypothetical protein
LIRPVSSPAIQRGTAINRLAVLAVENWLRLFVNGQQVGEVYHDERPWGQITWLWAQRGPPKPMVVYFSDFAVATPDSPDQLAPVLVGPQR